MKKILYSMLFIFLIFIGINNVDAKTCEYSYEYGLAGIRLHTTFDTKTNLISINYYSQERNLIKNKIYARNNQNIQYSGECPDYMLVNIDLISYNTVNIYVSDDKSYFDSLKFQNDTRTMIAINPEASVVDDEDEIKATRSIIQMYIDKMNEKVADYDIETCSYQTQNSYNYETCFSKLNAMYIYSNNAKSGVDQFIKEKKIDSSDESVKKFNDTYTATMSFYTGKKAELDELQAEKWGYDIDPEIKKALNTNYSELLGDLKNPLSVLAPQALEYELELNGGVTNLNAITGHDGICSEGNCEEPKYQTELGLRNIKTYCNEIKKLDPNKYNNSSINNRINECNSFDEFYDRLVSEGIVSNLASGCGFISSELKQKLNWILNIIKIAGPILAIVLGMLDFAKVVAVGDPDKGMKEAWKKFQKRLIAAVILFLVPILLSIPLNIIIGDKLEDDPFCSVID